MCSLSYLGFLHRSTQLKGNNQQYSSLLLSLNCSIQSLQLFFLIQAQDQILSPGVLDLEIIEIVEFLFVLFLVRSEQQQSSL